MRVCCAHRTKEKQKIFHATPAIYALMENQPLEKLKADLTKSKTSLILGLLFTSLFKYKAKRVTGLNPEHLKPTA